MATTASAVSLQEITVTTVRVIADLRVAPGQESFVASNLVSIAQAHFHRDAWFRGVFVGERPVGFVMLRDRTLLAPGLTLPEISLWRFMIDHRFQGTGIGRKALTLVVAHVRSKAGITEIRTSCVKGASSPVDFYFSFGPTYG